MNDLQDSLQNVKTLLEKKQEGEAFHRAEFHTLLDEVHLALDRQDSDTALNKLIQGAVHMHASDIHLEIHEHESVPRFRIDGDLAPLGMLSLHEHQLLVERMKYRSNLKLNIHTVPQDGKFRLGSHDDEAHIDIRVSVMPTRYGESIVCRVLDASHTIMTLDALGLIGPVRKLLADALTKKQGMILVTGPTGSGKTTTLYTLIDILKNPEDKIITLEDPIEYQIPDVLQSEINEREGYTFASGVRSVLRHDPDIIMIGEIRDLDTANTALQAALTGHLVLSTLHTKSATETLDRLLNMGVSAYDIAASCDVIVAQRLVRRTCRQCSLADDGIISDADRALMDSYGAHDASLQHGVGCESCGYTGYTGRIGIYEILFFSDEIREAIRAGRSDSEIRKIAQNTYFFSFYEDARAKILLGMTTEKECQRNGVL